MAEIHKLSLCCLLAFSLGVGVFAYADGRWYDEHEVSISMPCTDQYPYLSPLLDCKDIEEKFSDIEQLGKDVEHILDEETSAGHIARASFFYRDLNTRRFVGVNDSAAFYPASLAKLPIAIVYYLMSQLQTGLMDVRLEITADDLRENERQYPKDEDPLSVGEYPIRELIYHMLVHSENAPVGVLLKKASPHITKVTTDLGLYAPSDKEGEAGKLVITARTYANVFRLLYNASYLPLSDSNALLDILTQSTFQGGIARVPDGVKVSHKFGEATKITPEGQLISRVLSHCGIVYKPEEPYIICIMTEGQDFEVQKRVIERIADLVYERQ